MYPNEPYDPNGVAAELDRLGLPYFRDAIGTVPIGPDGNPQWSDDEPQWFLQDIYDGPMYGHITTHYNRWTGEYFFLNRNQWMVWNGHGWHFTGDRTYKVHYQTFAGFAISLIVLVAGGVIGNGVLPIAAGFAVLLMFFSILNDYLQNHHPRAAQVSYAINAALIAKQIHQGHRMLSEQPKSTQYLSQTQQHYDSGTGQWRW